MASIHTLPPELLVTIFLCYTEVLADKYEHAPELSSSIVASRHACVEDMLLRSGDVPLRLLPRIQEEETEDSLKAYSLAFSYLHRFTNVTLRLTNELRGLLCQPNVVQVANSSSLQKLSVDFLHLRYFDSKQTPLLGHITFPALQHFVIRGGDLRSCAPMLSSSLRHLELRSMDSYLTGKELATYLPGLKNLLTLVIVGVLWDDPDDFSDPDTWVPHQTIIFPLLRQLRVTGSCPAYICRLFAHIVYPASTHVKIELHNLDMNLDALPSVVGQIFAPHAAGAALPGPTPAFRRVTVEERFTDDAFIQGWADAAPADAQTATDGTLQPLLTLNATRDHDIAAGMLEHLSLSGVVDLRVANVDLSSYAWAALFRALPELHSLSVMGFSPVSTLPDALPRQGLSHLKSIRYDLSWTETPIEPFSDLAEALARRKRHESRLETLTVVLAPEHRVSEVDEEIKRSSYEVVRAIRFTRLVAGEWWSSSKVEV
ncbi:hypothetical protein PHLGIDRAFT_471044 [Phlebiopsis gigantea 11061_1 CR5-6]|uniref:F-box domain-containing protein n=1 Tax=Phlebiopsis gigantea (strain 11061_1 CR5-6) TaxID=745531 RepID=A0A0C3S6E0_PHLG1|nr:hypothetical protein PHLGIDRAFT_471044 [Phlebiopsis gigantea 11061_1 CR5-6]